MKLVVKTFFGLEPILKKELEALGGRNCNILKRAVECEGDREFLYKAALSASTALRILLPFAEDIIHTEKDLYRKVKKIEWDKYFGVNDTFAIDAVVNSTFLNHSKFVALRVKDAIVDQFRDKYEIRPNVDTINPDFRLNIHVAEQKITFSMDCIGFSMHQRGYRVPGHESPINEVLASGLLELSEWDGEQDFLDPMCGSGTIVIAAAMKASKIPCNWNVRHFAFMNWKDFDEKLWKSLRADYQKNFIKPNSKFYASDKDKLAIENAEDCARNAGVFDCIEFSSLFFNRLKINIENGIILFNPPYGERLELENAIDFYKSIGDTLKSDYSQNNKAYLITSNLPAVKHLGLKPARKIELYNGKLECRLMKYDLYQGSKREPKSTD